MGMRISSAIVALLCMAGCGTSQTYHNITTEQRNEAWQQVALNRIAVVAVTDDRSERIGSETVFVDRMKQRGVDAIVSHDIITNLSTIDTSQEAVEALRDRGVDAVLTIGLAKPASGYDRSTYWQARGWAAILGSDNTRAWGDLADINDYWSQGEYSVDIGLWDARSMEAIWHAQTDSNEWDEGSAGVSRLADAITGMLAERGFVAAE